MKVRRLIALCVVFLFCFSFFSFAVDTKTNLYVRNCYADISVNAAGDVVVAFTVVGVRVMTQIGASTIHIISSDGTIAETYYASVPGNESMMTGPSISHTSSVIFEDAVPGTRYCAIVFFKASDGNGYGSDDYTTGYITA